MKHDLSVVGIDIGSCIRPLRRIHAAQESATMPAFHHSQWGHCHGITPLFLRTRPHRSGVALPPALLAGTERRRPAPADRALAATPTHALPCTQSVCGPDAQAALCPV